MPLPGPGLFPNPYLFPGPPPGPFTEVVLDAVSPWNDINGFWATYNVALATMFESIYDIVADQGDPSETIIGLLGEQLDPTQIISEIPVQAVGSPELIEAGTLLFVSYGQYKQEFKTNLNYAPGDTTISIYPATPNYAYPLGSTIQLAFVPGWSTLLDPNNCPDLFLPYLAQFNGTDIPVGLDPDTMRAKITGESALQRGTAASIASAVQRNLTGDQTVVLQERLSATGTEDAYHFIVVVRPEEVIDTQAIIDAVDDVKPGGVMWTLVETDAWTISEMEQSANSISLLEGGFVTITGLENDQEGT